MKPFISMLGVLLLSLTMTTANATTRHKHVTEPYVETGEASWYGGKFNGRKTASGERFNSSNYTVAHKFLPLGTIVSITNLRNGKIVKARVNDRGPYVKHRIIDLSKATANAVDITGTAPVKITAVSIPEPMEVAEYTERRSKPKRLHR